MRMIDAGTALEPSRVSAAMEAMRTERAPIRVTHVLFDFDGGGLESLVAEMAGRFQGSSVEVSLVTLSGRMGRLGAATRHRFENFRVIRPVPIASMALPLSAASAIRQNRPHVVHLHTGAWYKGVKAARLAGAPRVVYTEHGREHNDPVISRWIDRRAATFTDAVVAVSNRLAGYLARDVGISSDKIVTIQNGVDTSAFTPGHPSTALRQALGIPDGAMVIGSVGRLEAVKAYDRLLDATALLQAQGHPPFAVVLFGDGSQREALRAQAERLGIDAIVRMPGWSAHAIDAHRLLDVFVLPSWSEGQSVSLMESMACGIVPVVTNVGANAETVGPELADHVVEPGSAEALAHAIRVATSSTENMLRIGAKVRRQAVERYSVDRMIESYERVYRGWPVLNTES